MASSYVNDLRLNEMATGDASGTWGDTTNTNLELIAEAFSYGTEAITTNADTHTTTIADGATDPGRSMFLKYTGTLDSTCTITIGPNTVSKLWIIENGTSGSQSIIIKQGSGATITIPSGKTKVIYSDGAGSGGAMFDAFASLNLQTSGIIETSASIQTALIEYTDGDDAMTIADGGGVTFAQTATFSDDIIIGDGKTIGSASDVDAMTIAANGQVTFTQTLIGTALDISGDIDVDGTTNLDVVDIDGAVDMASTLGVTGVVTANAGVVVDDITIDGTQIDLSSGDLTLDVAGDIILDADGGVVYLNDGGVGFGQLVKNSNDFRIFNPISDGDIVFRGNDNGSVISALTLDMSAAGAATFNAGVTTTAVITGGSYNVGGTAVIDSGRNLVNMGNVNGAAGIFGSLAVDNFTLNGTTLALSSGDFTLDVASDIILNADGGDWKFQDGTTGILEIQNDGNGNAVLITTTSDKDMRFLGNDNGSTITALTLDMSAAGAATFNSTIAATGATLTASTASIVLAKPDAGNLQFSFDGSNSNIASNSSTATINFQPSSTTRMTLAVGGTLTTFPLADKHAVFNENGVDADFRVESDGNANMLFVDGGNNRVGVGTGTPSTTFDVQGSTLINGDLLIGATDAGNKSITIAGGATGNEEGGEIRLATAADHDGTYDFYRIDVNQDDFRIGRQGQTDFTITSTGAATFNSSVSTPTLSSPDGTSILTLANSGEAQFGRGIVVNEAGLDSDFRVESDGNANMLFVDAGNNVVCVGGTTVETADHFEVISSDATTNLRIRNSNAGATGGQIVFDKSSASPADADVLGIINWIGNDSAGNANQFAQIEAKSADVTNGTEDGTLRFGTTVAGTFRYAMDIIDGTVTIPVLNNGYNFQAFASSSNSFFGVRDDGNDSVILQADRSDGFTGFLYNGHTLALSIGGALSKGSGSFKIDHPLEAKKDTHHLVHSFIEGPQADLIYRGRVTLSGGSAAVNVDTASDMTDGTFVVLCRDVQCFTSNETGWTAVKGVVSGNTLTITAQDNSCTDTISWMVVGERQDPHMKDSLTDWTDSDGKIIVEPAKT